MSKAKSNAAVMKDAEDGFSAGISEKEIEKLVSLSNDWEGDGDDDGYSEIFDETEIDEKNLASLKFSDEIKILLIGTVEYRLICQFLGVQSPKDIQNAIYKHVTMIGHMNQQCLIPFMKENGFDFSGEIYFADGLPVPVVKQTWSIKGKEVGFTSTGYMFFEKKGAKNKKQNMVAHCWTDYNSSLAGVTLYTDSVKHSKQTLEKLETYTKKHNCIRGAKLRDVNMGSSTFAEVVPKPTHNWENYYFPQHIRDMFELEVFGFLKETDRYNKLGITKRGVMMHGPPGTGKCLAIGTSVLMYDGSIKTVEDIVPSDLLMGPDSKPRFVKSIAHGKEKMYKITPTRGDSYTVNESHILSLRMGRDITTFKKHEIVNIPIKNYLSKSCNFKRYAMGWRSSVDFFSKNVEMDPYLLGVWLGDGSSDDIAITNTDKVIVDHFESIAKSYGLNLKNKTLNENKCPTWRATTGVIGGDISIRPKNRLLEILKEYNLIKNKHIPLIYKANSREVRLKLLAGMIDSDGYVSGSGFGITLKNELLLDDIIYICRSLGLAAYKTQSNNICTNSKTKEQGIYWRCHISGDVSIIPTKLKHADRRLSTKNVLNVSIKIEDVGEGDYYGFEIDGDGLFLLGDFTVTHNTTIGNIICNEAVDSTVILITPELVAENNSGKQSIKLLYMLADFVSPSVIFLEDLDLFAEDRDNTQGDIALGGLMNVLDGVNQVKNAVTVATTNRLELIEKALSNRPGRFDRVVEVPVMPPALREKMFTDRFKECKVDEGVIADIVKRSEGMTGAECQEFVNSMNLLFIHRKQDANRHVTASVVDKTFKTIQALSTVRKQKSNMGF